MDLLVGCPREDVLRIARFWLSFILLAILPASSYGAVDRAALKEQAYEMFMHGYQSYMKHAYPADELMPLSCKGRFRGVTPSRGDVDDSLGNFSLTLVDTLDTLMVMGAYDEFEEAVQLVVDNVRFDSDLVVSVFETNIRMVGGLISGHLMAELLRGKEPERLRWYKNRQLLKMAVELADRLLPAFNTTSGIPFSRINLRHGMQDHLRRQKDTCTACGGTMLLEMAALSRLTGNPVYEEKARKAMDFLWTTRHRASDLMGTVLDVHNGQWVRRESGIGAGIDSYYEYCLKAYILLGDTAYLERFNKHYTAIMRYVNKGPLFFEVQMHRPTIATRSFMDSLLAFWPGLQVLKGDVAEAVQMHEMLFQVVQKHKFLPEAFTHDLQVHWAEHPLRPEFIESTYFLYRATKDPHYMEVAEAVMKSLNENVRVPCGWAGVKDLRVMTHEDRMDSFVLSETFKYLFLIFSDPADLPFDPDDYVLTTEAHFLPLSIGDGGENAVSHQLPRRLMLDPDERISNAAAGRFRSAMPHDEDNAKTGAAMSEEARFIRERTQSLLEELAVLQRQHANAPPQQVCAKSSERLRAWAFSATNEEHVQQLREMGIQMTIQEDNRILLTHQPAAAKSIEHAKMGAEFMAEVIEIAKKQDAPLPPVAAQDMISVQLLASPHHGLPVLPSTLAQFGSDLPHTILARAVATRPLRACQPLENAHELVGRAAVVERSDCLFQEKARHAQTAGAVAVIVIDHQEGTAWSRTPAFSMSGEKGEEDIFVPTVFLFRAEGEILLAALKRNEPVTVSIGRQPLNPHFMFAQRLHDGIKAFELSNEIETCSEEDGLVVRVEDDGRTVIFAFRFGKVSTDSEPIEHQGIVERHINHIEDIAEFASRDARFAFLNLVRSAAYGALGLAVKPDPITDLLIGALRSTELQYLMPDPLLGLTGELTRVRCTVRDDSIPCMRVPAA